MPLLRIKLPGHGEVTHIVSGDRVTVGRRPDNAVQILDRSVSAHHAELVAEDGHYRLRDLGSTNGLSVDGEPTQDFHLHHSCRITFGHVECEFDAAGSASAADQRMEVAHLERDIAFLRGENSDLLARMAVFQRQIDILGSARLVTGRSDPGGGPAAAEFLRAVTCERDTLRQEITTLRTEMDDLRDELAVTLRERDAAREDAELLRMELHGIPFEPLEVIEKKGTQRIGSPLPIESPTNAPPADPTSDTQRLTVAVPAGLEAVPPLLGKLRAALDILFATPGDLASRTQAAGLAGEMAQALTGLGEHPLVRIARGVDDLLRDLRSHQEAVRPSTVRTLLQATEFMGTLLGAAAFERTRSLPTAHILAIDDDAELLATVVASLHLAEIQTVACANAEEALSAVKEQKFDLLLSDLGLPGLDGIAFCARARELPAYRKTPIVFLTVSDTLEKRADASLSGGTDFIGKPFNVFDLALKVQTWSLKHMFAQV